MSEFWRDARVFEDAAPDIVIQLAARVEGIGTNLAAPADPYAPTS